MANYCRAVIKSPRGTGPDIPFLGIFVSNFRHFVFAVYFPHSSADGLYRILSSYLLVHFYLMKNIRPSAVQADFRANFSADFAPVSKHKMYCIVPAFYGDQFGGKENSFHIHKPSFQALADK